MWPKSTIWSPSSSQTLHSTALGDTLETFFGNAVMAVFGLPQAHRDDPERVLVALSQRTGGRAQLDRTRSVVERVGGRQEAIRRGCARVMRLAVRNLRCAPHENGVYSALAVQRSRYNLALRSSVAYDGTRFRGR